MNPVLLDSGEGKTVNVIGTAITIRLRGAETGGAISVVESVNPPGGGPPPHVHHREDETFQVLEGEFEFTCGGRTWAAQKGSTIFAPRDVPHSYRVVGQTSGRLMSILTPAGFEGFFEEVGALSPEQQEIPRVMEIAEKYALEFLPRRGV